MATMRSRVVLVAGALGVVLAGTVGAAAQEPVSGPPAQVPYPITLRYGTGLIDNPVAWISPNDGDLWVGLSATHIPGCGSGCGQGFSQQWNDNLSIETHWIHLFSVGLSVYSNNPEWGLYGQVLALSEKEDSWRPAVAVGFRNLGPYSHEERFLIGHDVNIDSTGGTTPVNPKWALGFHTAPSFYAVATKHWTMGSTGSISASLGLGSGIFSQDGGLGKNYNDRGTIVRGLFLGGRYAFRPSESMSLSFLLENNGWDWNAGVVADWKGLFIGLYGTELEEGGQSPSHGSMYTVYNYTKINLQIGLSTNIFAAAKGSVLRDQVGDLKRQQAQLNAEIAQHEATITQLEDQLRRAQAGELAEVAKKREALDAQIQEEKEAIKRAEERLEQLQGGQKPPPPPPSGTPPQ